MSNSPIWPTERTLSGVTTPSLSGPGSDDNEGLLGIPQSLGLKPLYLIVIQDIRLEWSYPSVEMKSVYSTAPVDWTAHNWLVMSRDKNQFLSI